MAIISTPRTRPMSFYRNHDSQGREYTPDVIGSWVATSDRDMPWHTIGKALEGSAGKGKGQTVDHLMTAAEALALAGLDFDVRKIQVTDPETGKPIPRMYATYYDPADEDRYYFGAVSDKYEVVKPSAQLGFYDEVLHNYAGAHYSAAWAMREKSQMGVTIEFPETIVIDPGGSADEVGLYGLGFNSFDGSTGLGWATTAVRFWCMNQLPPIMRVRGQHVRRGFSFKHTSGVSGKVRKAQEIIGITFNWAKAFDEIANRMMAQKVTDAQLEKMMKVLKGAGSPFTFDKGDSALIQSRVNDRIGEVMTAWRAPHNAHISGTKWGAYNVLVEYMDWGRTVKGSSRTGTDPIRQRAIGTLVNGNVAVYKKEVWELCAA